MNTAWHHKCYNCKGVSMGLAGKPHCNTCALLEWLPVGGKRPDLEESVELVIRGPDGFEDTRSVRAIDAFTLWGWKDAGEWTVMHYLRLAPAAAQEELKGCPIHGWTNCRCDTDVKDQRGSAAVPVLTAPSGGPQSDSHPYRSRGPDGLRLRAWQKRERPPLPAPSINAWKEWK